MTTIAYRDGILAADTLVTDENVKYRKTLKIAKAKSARSAGCQQILVAACGDSALCAAFLAWAEDGGFGDDLKKRPVLKVGDRKAYGYVFRNDRGLQGRVTEFEGDLPPVTFEVEGYFAAGSGREFAIGAMHCGANAAAAVDAAIGHDLYSGGRVEAVGFDVEPPKVKAKKK